MSRIILISDIHGCLDELKELIQKCNITSNDRFICLGDLIDRGPYSAETIKYIRQNGFESIIGNHDEKLLRYYRNEQKKIIDPKYINKMHKPEIYDQLNQEDYEWLQSLSYYLEFNINNINYIAVHGGFRPNIPIQVQENRTICRIRYLDIITNKMVPCDYNEVDGYTQPANTYYWTERWIGRQDVIYGHIVNDLENIRIDVQDYKGIARNTTCYGIDTGCCFGGRLTGLILEENKAPEIIQVQAHKTYQERHVKG